MPVNQQDIDDFTLVWMSFDPNGNGTLPCHLLERLITDLAGKSQCRLVQNKKRLLKNVTYRRKYIAALEIPSHEKFGIFNFTDVLLCMSRQVVESSYIKDQITEQRQLSVNQQELQKELGKTQVNQAIREKLEANEKKKNLDPKVEFRKAVLGISRLDKEIASVAELTKTAAKMAKRGFKNIDIKYLEED